jgi:hypothetical protein
MPPPPASRCWSSPLNAELLEKAREQAARYGNHRYLDKPFDLDAMLSHIRAMIGEA